jgi:beta-N-acetylhexosaminidase
LPVVSAGEEELETDLEPFRTLKDAPMGMTSHLLYTVWDSERPASQSPVVINDIIRGRIGFDGLLMTDDLGMHALSGGFDERTRLALEAGCDVALHCSGKMEEMLAVASAAGPLTDKGRERLERAMATIPDAGERPAYAELAERRDRLLASVA